jgi:hypothetical protein
LRNPETIFNQLKGRMAPSSDEQWAYFTGWTLLHLSKMDKAAIPRFADSIYLAYEAEAKSGMHACAFSVRNLINNNNVPQVKMLHKAACLLRLHGPLNVEAKDAEMYRRPDRRNRGVVRGGQSRRGRKKRRSVESGYEADASERGVRGHRPSGGDGGWSPQRLPALPRAPRRRSPPPTPAPAADVAPRKRALLSRWRMRRRQRRRRGRLPGEAAAAAAPLRRLS